MKEETELLEYMHETAEMGAYTLTELLKDLETKENKITPVLEDILTGYQEHLTEIRSRLSDEDIERIEAGIMQKMGAKMGIKREVFMDNSDASIVHMVIKGIDMGEDEMEKRINDYNDKVDKQIIKMANDFLKFEQEVKEKLKKYI